MTRLNKFLADSGICARRKADALISAGSVTVDGRVARVGESIDPSRQRVAVGGRRVTPPPIDHVTLVLNKPRGVITTMSDDRGRNTVARLLPMGRRLFPVGRLDADSTGVLLCTTDGQLARVLTHPSFGVEKLYRVRAAGKLTARAKAALGALRFNDHRDGTVTLDITLREGRNRQVRRLCAQQGLRVLELTRLKFGPVELAGLGLGKTRALTQAEKRALERLRKDQKRSTVRPTE